jgi:tetratricopeptide (TPR) repeat protein
VLVLADFANNTGDPIFNTTLREALAVQLEQSPFLKIMGDEQVRQDLKFMGRSSDEHITSQLAREICQREGDKARVDGTIAQLGKTYAITLEATNCQTGEPLAREQAQAADKDHVLQAISTAVSGMRRKLGESLASIQKLDRPLGQVTTTSLEAFQAYSLGLEQFLRGDYAASIPFFQRATELDPNFGAAWRHLGLSFGNSRRGTRRAEEGLTKAFTLRDRASERERLASLGSYYRLTRDLAKATDASELWARTYPRDAEPHVNLGHLHEFMGQLEEASKEYEEAYRLEPWVTVVANRLMNSYVNLSRLEDAKAVADKTFARHVDPAEIHQQFLWIAFVQENLADAAREIHWFVDKPEEGVSLVFQALNAATHGQLHSAREVFKRSIDVAKQRNLPAVVGMSLSNSQSMSVIGSNCPAMRSLGGAAAMLCSDADASLKAAEDEAKQYPSDPTVNAIQLPTLRAAVELKRDNAAKAVESLQLVAPYERANASAIIYRGLAYLLLHREVEAGAEFQKILDNPGNYWGGPEYLLAYLGRARAAALSGDTAKSKKVYQEFFALWKDADQDIPLLLEARKEYAALK